MVATITRKKPTKEEAFYLIDVANDIALGKEVLCPRCGKPLLLEEKGNSFTVMCSDDECISSGCRGI